MTLLYLQLPDGEGPAHAWQPRADGIADLGRGEPAQFAQQYSGSACVVFLPSSSCLFATAAISARQLRQAEQSLGWLIEDQTGEDAESLHVVAGTPEGESTPLLAINRDALAATLARLRADGLAVIAALPDLCLVPRDDSDWQLVPQGDRLFLRTGELGGAVLEAGVLEAMLDGALLERGNDPLPVISVASGAPEAWARIERWAESRPGIGLLLSEQLDPGTALAAVPDWSRHPGNLLRGDFAIRGQRSLPSSLRWAAVFLAAAFALQLVSEWTRYGYYRYQADKVSTQAVARYRALYPDENLAPKPKAAWAQVQQRMRGKRNEQQGDSSVLPTLTRVAQALQGSGLSTQRVDVVGGVLTLDVDARSLGELDGFKQRLDGEGFVTEIVSANNQGGVLRGRLRVEGGA